MLVSIAYKLAAITLVWLAVSFAVLSQNPGLLFG